MSRPDHGYELQIAEAGDPESVDLLQATVTGHDQVDCLAEARDESDQIQL